ncbi:MAG: glycosyltransferase family 9 protein [Archangium sp.]|nr:glycosyltransferase family 9 protein [Archangium sp.]MDP3157299.1 glycosyltransferase family 9 protein [Archangium sp.]MDP3571137.1 glycosyltransferase family 9 protein [Archangium sp.]
MKSILLIRYSALGDVVLASGLVAPLRAKYPGVRIEWATEKAFAGLLEGVVDRVIPFSRKDPSSRAAVLLDVKGRFDLAIDLQNKFWSMRVSRAAAPKRLRFVRRTALQALGSLVGRDVILDEAPATELYAKAAGLEASGPLQVRVSDAAHARAAQLLPEGSWVAVAPGAAWETKRWPAARLAEVAAALRADGHRIVLVGGPMDGELLDVIRAGCQPEVDLSAESLPVLAAALSRVKLLIGNDSGLVHVAGAMGRPALALFGPTSVRRWGPRAPGVALSLGLSCSPCTNHGGRSCPLGHHNCLQKLEVVTVLMRARELLTSRL